MSTACTKSNSSESLHLSQQAQAAVNAANAQNNADNQPRVASIRSRPTSSRITAAELEVP